jgi:hypothetical protein
LSEPEDIPCKATVQQEVARPVSFDKLLNTGFIRIILLRSSLLY